MSDCGRGYGDISATTPSEQIYSMVMMLVGVTWYAFVVGAMSSECARGTDLSRRRPRRARARSEAGSALRARRRYTGAVGSFDQEAQKVHEKMRQVTSFIRENELPLDLGRKVRSFLKHIYTSKRMKIASSYEAESDARGAGEPANMVIPLSSSGTSGRGSGLS